MVFRISFAKLDFADFDKGESALSDGEESFCLSQIFLPSHHTSSPPCSTFSTLRPLLIEFINLNTQLSFTLLNQTDHSLTQACHNHKELLATQLPWIPQQAFQNLRSMQTKSPT